MGLEDLSTPEHVWQLRHALLQQEFPPLVKSVPAAPAAEQAEGHDPTDRGRPMMELVPIVTDSQLL